MLLISISKGSASFRHRSSIQHHGAGAVILGPDSLSNQRALVFFRFLMKCGWILSSTLQRTKLA